MSTVMLISVARSVATLFICFVTEFTFVRPRIVVAPSVAATIIPAFKVSAANITCIWSLIAMGRLMRPGPRVRGEILVTKRTRVKTFPRVTSQVISVDKLLWKPSLTEMTHKVWIVWVVLCLYVVFEFAAA